MDSKISDVAKALGLSSQAVRLYEEKGILHCRRDVESGYRVFDRENITALLRGRLLRSFGFGMSDIAAMTHDLEAEEVLALYEKRGRELELEIENLQAVKRYLTRLDETTRTAIAREGECEIVTSPAYYLLPFMEGTQGKHTLNHRIIHAWNDLYPFRWDTCVIGLETMGTEEMKYRIVAVIEEKYVERLPPMARVGLIYHPAQKSVTAWFSREESTHIPFQRSLSFALRYIEEQGLQLNGDVVVSALLLLKRSSSQRAIFSASLPVK